MNESYTQWFDKQKEIYINFSKGAVLASEHGTKPDPILAESKGGYCLVFRPDDEIMQLASLFALGVHNAVFDAAYPYQIDQLHTTVFDYRVDAGFRPDQQPDHEQVLYGLSQVADIVTSRWQREGEKAAVFYGGYGFNQTAAILKGFPNEAFFRLVVAAMELARSENMEVKLPWGGHVTTNRFKAVTSGNRIQALFDVIANHNFDLSALSQKKLPYKSIDVCWFTADVDGGFNLRTVESFKL